MARRTQWVGQTMRNRAQREVARVMRQIRQNHSTWGLVQECPLCLRAERRAEQLVEQARLAQTQRRWAAQRVLSAASAPSPTFEDFRQVQDFLRDLPRASLVLEVDPQRLAVARALGWEGLEDPAPAPPHSPASDEPTGPRHPPVPHPRPGKPKRGEPLA